MRILEYPKVEQINDHEWKLLEDLSYKVHNSDSDVITVKAGFITDFASVPKLFWNILPPFGTYSSAAIIHDYEYSIRGTDKVPPRSRKECDGIFLEAMEVLKVTYWKRMVMYRAVRSFGWIYWNKR